MRAGSNVLSTKGQVAPFEYWHDVVCQNFTALSTTPVGARPFVGEIRTEHTCPDTSLSTISAGAQVVRRTPSDIANRPSGAVFVNIQMAGRCVIETKNGASMLLPGDVTLLDADTAFSMRFDRSFSQACLHVALDHLFPDGILSGTVLRAKRTETRQIRNLLGDLAQSADPKEDIEALLCVVRTGAEQANRHALLAQHLTIIKAYVARQSDDPSLSPAQVAHHFSISKRHIHNLFTLSGETFGQHVQYLRLKQACRRMSETPQAALGAIARQSGFNSSSHFSKVFTRHFGESPRNWRRGVPSQLTEELVSLGGT